MYGMNLALPFSEEPWAYGAIVAFSIFVVAVVFFIARKKNIF
jgi:Mg2+ and Co2+ transporter CorA